MIKSETYKTLHTPFLNAYKEYKKETGFTRDQVEDTDILETMGTAMLKILLIQMISLLDEEDISRRTLFVTEIHTIIPEKNVLIYLADLVCRI